MIGWGIVGIGSHADRNIAPAIVASRGAKLVAAASRDLARATAFASKHGAERAYCSYAELLADPGVQAVYIATPNNQHAEQVQQAAQARKHVLVEKPMALSVYECESMISACREAGVKCGVGFQQRNHPGIKEARQMVSSGRLGELTIVKGERSHLTPSAAQSLWRKDPLMAGGNVMMASGVHLLDLLCHVVGSRVVEVTAMIDSGTENKSLDITTAALVRFASGALGFMDCSERQLKPTNELVISGTRATVTGQGLVPMPASEAMLSPCILTLIEDDAITKIEYSWQNLFLKQIEAFVTAIVEDSEPVATGIEGLHIVQVTSAIFDSAREGRAIRLA